MPRHTHSVSPERGNHQLAPAACKWFMQPYATVQLSIESRQGRPYRSRMDKVSAGPTYRDLDGWVDHLMDLVDSRSDSFRDPSQVKISTVRNLKLLKNCLKFPGSDSLPSSGIEFQPALKSYRIPPFLYTYQVHKIKYFVFPQNSSYITLAIYRFFYTRDFWAFE